MKRRAIAWITRKRGNNLDGENLVDFPHTVQGTDSVRQTKRSRSRDCGAQLSLCFLLLSCHTVLWCRWLARLTQTHVSSDANGVLILTTAGKPRTFITLSVLSSSCCISNFLCVIVDSYWFVNAWPITSFQLLHTRHHCPSLITRSYSVKNCWISFVNFIFTFISLMYAAKRTVLTNMAVARRWR